MDPPAVDGLDWDAVSVFALLPLRRRLGQPKGCLPARIAQRRLFGKGAVRSVSAEDTIMKQRRSNLAS